MIAINQNAGKDLGAEFKQTQIEIENICEEESSSPESNRSRSEGSAKRQEEAKRPESEKDELRVTSGIRKVRKLVKLVYQLLMVAVPTLGAAAKLSCSCW